ncbi:hypothetical protein H2200_006767 [Cladophialophora chaetospira]|uniref:Heterokaryon incompatibility domain-containing protein n=1 Tax=Cladophialophora chaetospira TaxID=386627 RepID=A0AA39CI88_9EURO|nr:hypothetical protein H2200_006767 [Cladophialophora chaetospira]
MRDFQKLFSRRERDVPSAKPPRWSKFLLARDAPQALPIDQNLTPPAPSSPVDKSTSVDDLTDISTSEASVFPIHDPPPPQPPATNARLDDVLAAIVTGGPLADLLNDPRGTGIKPLPADSASARSLTLIHPSRLPADEAYPGPLPWATLQQWDTFADQRDLVARVVKGESPDPGLCRRCRRLCLIRPSEGAEGGVFTDDQRVQFRPMGSWFQLLMRTKCRICRLLVLSLSCGTWYLNPLLARVTAEAQYCQLIPETLETGERVLAAEYALRRVGLLRMITGENWREVCRQAWEVEIETKEPFELLRDEKSVFHDKSGQTTSVGMIDEWIKTCEGTHGGGCQDIWRPGKVPQEWEIFLIDVQDRCLVKRAVGALRYYALSYVRGDSVIPATTKANVEQHMVKGAFSDPFPATIEDAIQLVQKLGERYLWVDSLCIIQDDLASKDSDIRRVDSIYSNGAATIVALAGRNADAGLPGIRPGTRPPQRLEVPQLHERFVGPDPKVIRQLDYLAQNDPVQHEFRLSARHIAVKLEDTSDMRDFIATHNSNADLHPPPTSSPSFTPFIPAPPPRFIAAEPPSLKHILSMTNWSSRGWTLQERLLSRRTVYFSTEYVYFQCATHTLCETGGNLLPWSDVSARNGDRRKDPDEPNTLLHFRHPSPTASITHDPISGKPVLLKQDFDAYAQLIEQYSRRQLSFQSDTLAAVSGMLGVVHAHVGGLLIAGMPSKYLDLAIMWTAGAPLDRITPVGGGGNEFPSWSWAAWEGRKQFRLAVSNEDSYGGLQREWATSEIRKFRLFHLGKVVEIFKTREDLMAMESRNLGSLGKGALQSQFTRYVPYSSREWEQPVQGPDLGPNVLEFVAKTVPFASFGIQSIEGTAITEPEHGNVKGQQVVCGLLDNRRRQCGLLFKFDIRTRYREGFDAAKMEYVLISSFEDASESVTVEEEGRMRHTGIKTMDQALKPFDPYAFPWRGKGSGLVNLLVVEWCGEVAERIGVAQVVRDAWERVVWGRREKYVRLA